MSWIDRELKRRAAASSRLAPKQSSTNRIHELWDKLERANAALPSELQLRPEQGHTAPCSPDEATFELRARNGAALAFGSNGIRYVWPEGGRRWSSNFWIRWDAEQERYLLDRRLGIFTPGDVASYAFDDTRIDYMIKRLVMGELIKVRSVRKKRFRATVVAVMAVAIVGGGAALVYLDRISLPPGTEFDACVAKDAMTTCIDPVNACKAPTPLFYGPENRPFYGQGRRPIGANIAWCCPDGTKPIRYLPPATVKCEVLPKQ
jgi:hypothetical protein